MELIGLGMFLVVVVGAVVLGGLIAVLRVAGAICEATSLVLGALWECTPWHKRRASARAQERLDALNRAERKRIHVIDQQFLHSEAVDPARRAEFRERFAAAAREWFTAHPQDEALPVGFEDALLEEFQHEVRPSPDSGRSDS